MLLLGLRSTDSLHRLAFGSPPTLSMDPPITKGDDGESSLSLTVFDESTLEKLPSGFLPLSKVASGAEGGGVVVWRQPQLISNRLRDLKGVRFLQNTLEEQGKRMQRTKESDGPWP